MKSSASGYSYRYDALNDVYFVRRTDGAYLNGYLPDGLIKQIIREKRSKVKHISNYEKTYHFFEDGLDAFIDLNMRSLTLEEEEMIFRGEKVEPRGIQKILSLFKGKKR